MKPEALLRLHNINKYYQMGDKRIQVLKSLSLDIGEAESVAVLGASGCGKSTLMNILGLLDVADEGHYYFRQQDMARQTSDERAILRNRDIGFVFQQFHLLPRLNVKQNVALPLRYRPVAPDALEHKVRGALEKVGMDAFMQHRPSQLSGGQQQRVAIARALAGNPRLILADEPTGALDSKTGESILNLFTQLREEGRTLIIVTHDERVALRCQRQIRMQDGKIISGAVHALV